MSHSGTGLGASLLRLVRPVVVMAKVSSARSEFNCMPRLFDVLDSQNVCASPEMIADYSRKLDHHRTSFDDECRKIQYEADLSGSRVDAGERSLRDMIQEDKQILKQRSKETVVKRLQGKKSLKASMQPSTSAEMLSNRPAIAAPLEAVCSHSYRDEVRLSEGFQTGVVLAMHDRVDMNLQQGHTGDHDRKFESKPFSEALEVLNSDKDLIMDFLSEPNCLLQKFSRNTRSSQTERVSLSPYQKSNKTVILKSELQNGKSSGKIECHCSSGQSRDGSTRSALNGSLTSFSVKEIKRKLKHRFGSRRKESNSNHVPKLSSTSGKVSHNRFIFGHDCIYRGVEARSPLNSTTNAKAQEKLGRKQGLKIEREPQVAWETSPERRKIDVSSHNLCTKHGVDVVLVATRDLTERLKDLNPTERVITSHGTDFCLSPRRESQYCSGSARESPYRRRACLSPMRTSTEARVTPYDCTTDTVSTETNSSLVPSTEEEEDGMSSPTRNMKFIGMPNVEETFRVLHSKVDYDTMISNAQRAVKIELNDEYGSLLHCITDSIPADCFPSSPTSINQLDMRDTKNQEHLSPVSVLDQFFAEEYSSASNTASQSAREPLKPRCLHFEECILESTPEVQAITASSYIHKQDYTISNYVRVIIQASLLDWDQLSAIRPLSEHLLHPSLFDQAQFLLSDPHFDTKLLFDHVNEVLLETQRSHFVSPYWPAMVKPRICCLPLEEAVIDEIMREAEFYLLPQTQKRTLDQLVAKDLSGSRLQLDTRPETEQIIINISEDILEEFVLDVLLQLNL